MVHTNNLGFVIATDYEKNMTESRREHGTVKVVVLDAQPFLRFNIHVSLYTHLTVGAMQIRNVNPKLSTPLAIGARETMLHAKPRDKIIRLYRSKPQK